MSLPNVTDSLAPAPGGRRYRPVFWVVVLLGIGTAVGLGTWGWLQFQGKSPPEIPPLPSFIDDEVKKFIEGHADAVRADPWSAEKWGKLAFALDANGYGQDALVYLAQAEKLDPDDPRWTYGQGLILKRDHVADALPFFERSALRFPYSLVPRWRLAQSYYEVGKLEEAEKHFYAVVQANPSFGLAWLGLGRIAQDRGELTQAQAHLQKATRDAQSVKEAHRLLEQIYWDNKETTQAKQAAAAFNRLPDDLIPLDPLGTEINNLIHKTRRSQFRVDEFLAMREYDQALEMLERLRRTNPKDSYVIATMGRVWWLKAIHEPTPSIQAQFLALAQEKLEEARAINPNESGVDYYLGLVHLFQFDSKGPPALEKAHQSLEKAWKANPTNEHCMYSLSSCLVLEGDLDRALLLLRPLVRDYFQSEVNFLLLGDCLVYRGEAPESATNYIQAATLGRDGGQGLGKLLVMSLHQKW